MEDPFLEPVVYYCDQPLCNVGNKVLVVFYFVPYKGKA